jgi:hypothetical protein
MTATVETKATATEKAKSNTAGLKSTATRATAEAKAKATANAKAKAAGLKPGATKAKEKPAAWEECWQRAWPLEKSMMLEKV